LKLNISSVCPSCSKQLRNCTKIGEAIPLPETTDRHRSGRRWRLRGGHPIGGNVYEWRIDQIKTNWDQEVGELPEDHPREAFLLAGLAPCLVDFLAPLFANQTGELLQRFSADFCSRRLWRSLRDCYLGGAAGCQSRIGPDGIVLLSIRAENPPSTGFAAAPLGRRARRC
jgi:hypothetical protein